MFNKTSKHEADVDDCVVSLILSSLGHIESTCEWNWLLLTDKTSSMYLNVGLKATARAIYPSLFKKPGVINEFHRLHKNFVLVPVDFD
jgi:hypothetical protein